MLESSSVLCKISFFSYYLEPLDANSTVPFKLSEETGVLRVSGKLDFEQQREYHFNVLAKVSLIFCGKFSRKLFSKIF